VLRGKFTAMNPYSESKEKKGLEAWFKWQHACLASTSPEFKPQELQTKKRTKVLKYMP
jgi:hypothetical protein